jgi:hypothetical protein
MTLILHPVYLITKIYPTQRLDYMLTSEHYSLHFYFSIVTDL